MTKTLKSYLLILLTVFGFLLAFPYHDIVNATSIVYTQTFESQVNGADFSIVLDPNHFMQSVKTSGTSFKVSTTAKKTGTLGFLCDQGGGRFNLSYLTNTYLNKWNVYAYLTSSAGFIHFYNRTKGGQGTTNCGANDIICLSMSMTMGQTTYQYYTSPSTPVTVKTSAFGWANWIWNITSDTGLCSYCVDTTWSNQTVANSTMISQGYRIDAISFVCNSASIYTDDWLYTLSTGYGTSGGGDMYGCNDVSDYFNYGNQPSIINGYTDFQYPYIEFTTQTPVTITPKFFELYVGSGQYDINSDIDTYQLYVNGLYIGTADCLGMYSGTTWRLQWNVSSLGTITNTKLVFELICEGDSPSYWNLAVDNYNGEMGPFPQNYYVYYGNSNKVNGQIDQTQRYGYAPSWRIYYTDFGDDSGGNPDYTNDISLVGFQPSHPQWEIPFTYVYNTVYFDVYSNSSAGDYQLWVFDEDRNPVGFTQGYPITIYDYNKAFGFTPYAEGNYTVELIDGALTIANRSFNVTLVDVTYALWTFPNPSYDGSTYNVAVYINETDEQYETYAIMGFGTPNNANNPNKAYQTIIVGALTDGVWSTVVYNMINNGNEYWRLFGTNDNETWYPVTPIYTQYKYLTHEMYIDTSLTNDEGFVNQEFNIFGLNTKIKGTVHVYLDSLLLRDVSNEQNFRFPYTINDEGAYVLTLKALNNGTWEIIDSVIVSISEEGDGGSGAILPRINQPLGSIIGMIITIFCLLTPFILSASLHLRSGIHPIIYALTGGMGLAISTILGFFPAWLPFFVIACGVIIIVISYLRGQSSSGE